MKKMFKKSIAMLIAVLMVISAMPFTAITAFAATGTLSNSGFTIVANGATRWKNNQMNIVNDQGSDNTSLGIIKFDISSLKGKKIITTTPGTSKLEGFLGNIIEKAATEETYGNNVNTVFLCLFDSE